MATEERELHVVFGSGPVGRAVAAELVRGARRVRVVNRSGRAPGLELERRDEGPYVERKAVRPLPVPVPLKRDQLSAVHDVPKRAIEHGVVESLSEVTDDDGLRTPLV